jgi:hypothetical protein
MNAGRANSAPIFNYRQTLMETGKQLPHQNLEKILLYAQNK